VGNRWWETFLVISLYKNAEKKWIYETDGRLERQDGLLTWEAAHGV
jgi:hypothetical protein